MVAGRTGWEAASGGAESLDDAGGSTLALTAFSVGSEGGRGAAASDMARGGGGKGERQAWEELLRVGGGRQPDTPNSRSRLSSAMQGGGGRSTRHSFYDDAPSSSGNHGHARAPAAADDALGERLERDVPQVVVALLDLGNLVHVLHAERPRWRHVGPPCLARARLDAGRRLDQVHGRGRLGDKGEGAVWLDRDEDGRGSACDEAGCSCCEWCRGESARGKWTRGGGGSDTHR